jgi:hypothetical protein
LSRGQLLGPQADRKNFFGAGFFVAEFQNALFHTLGVTPVGVTPLHILAKRFPHEFGARAVPLPAQSLKLSHHLRRQRYGNGSWRAAHVIQRQWLST